MNMGGRQPSSRSLLAIVWTAFVLVWAMAALLAVTLTQVIACGRGGGSSSAAPGSPAGRYCNAVDGYFSSGEAGGLAALVYGWPLFVLGAVGVYGVWRCCKRLMVVVAAACSLLLVLHVTLAFSLPTNTS
jgi:uncharacterized membrane protein